MTLNKERKIINDLQNTLTDIAVGMDREETERAVRNLLVGFKEYDTIPDKKFYALFDPRKVPADARVDFVYTPTYLSCAIIICAVSEYDDLLEDEAIKETFYYGLNGCTGRKFLGAGYDDIDGFLDAMEIFAQCDVMSFIARFPDFIIDNFGYTEKFKLCIEQAKKLIGEGKSVIIWCIFIDSIQNIRRELEKIGYKTGVIYGDIDNEERAQIINDFKLVLTR